MQRSRGVPENGRRPSSHPARPPDHRTPAQPKDPYAVAPPRSRHHPLVGGRLARLPGRRGRHRVVGHRHDDRQRAPGGHRLRGRATPRSSSSTTCTGPDGVAVVCRISALDGGRNRVGTVEDAVPAQGADVGAPGGVAAHERARRDRASSTAAPGCCATPLSRGGAGDRPRARAPRPLDMVAIRARVGRLTTSHLGSGSDTRCRTAAIGTRARCRSTEAPPRAGRAPPMIQE